MQGPSTCFIVHDPGILGSARACDIVLFFAQRLSATRPVSILYINSSFNNTYKQKIDQICHEQRMAFVDLVVENTFDIQYLRKMSYCVFQSVEKAKYDYVIGYDFGGALFYCVAGKISGVYLRTTELILMAYDSLLDTKKRGGTLVEEKHDLEQIFLEEWVSKHISDPVSISKNIATYLNENDEAEAAAAEAFSRCLQSKIYVNNRMGSFSHEEIEQLKTYANVTDIIINSPFVETVRKRNEKVSDVFTKCHYKDLPARAFFEQADNYHENLMLVGNDFNLRWIHDKCALQIVYKEKGSIVLHSQNKIHSFSNRSVQKAVACIFKGAAANLQTTYTHLASLLEKPVSQDRGKRKTAGSRPKVSVCMTHYNRPDLLRYAIESIEKQTYSNFEVILVDDGSSQPDAIEYIDSLELKFTDNNWKILRQENKYLGAARNLAAKNAAGKYLLFMDDDNYALPHLIETLVSAAEYSGNEVITCALQKFSGGSKPMSDSEIIGYYLPLGSCLTLGTMENCFGDANSLIKKSAFDAIGGFTEDYGIGYEDWELFVKMAFAGYHILPLPEVLFWYRTSEASMVRTTNLLSNHKRVLRVFQEHCPPHLAPLLEFIFWQSQTLEGQRLASNFHAHKIVESIVKLFDHLLPRSSRRRNQVLKLLRFFN